MATTGKRRLASSRPRKSPVASNSVRKQPGSARRLHAQGVQTIEDVLSADRRPVLGLFLHTVHILLLRSLTRQPRFRSIMPHLIGTPALLSKHPGLSQIELAALLGTERATAGLQVAQCIEKGFVRRSVSAGDRRKYELYVTNKGLRLLAEAQRVVPEHEDVFAGALTAEERDSLRRLLMKLIAD